jgi:hypothetical protein
MSLDESARRVVAGQAAPLDHIASDFEREPTHRDWPLSPSKRAALIKRPRAGCSRPGPDTEEVTLEAPTP